MLLPLASATLLVLVGLRRTATPQQSSSGLSRPVPAGLVDGWTGSLEVSAGALSVRLSPLHSDAERQQFDARVLRRRLVGAVENGAGVENGTGQPWRLELMLDARAESAIELGGLGLSSSEFEADSRRAGLPRQLVFEDQEGAAPDPLAALFRAPVGALEPGASAQLLLWGPPPAGALRLRLPGGASIELTPASLRVGELPSALAGSTRALEAERSNR